MTKIDDGGPAFPPHHNPETHASGMTLRDWFAGQALVAVLGLGLKSEQADEMGIASISYQVADAMLKERGSS
ncbi:hypothetical protein [Cohaesibacter gelatinilyticus]|uniref:Uncharacterized protein n=1 Tax=Cohaesibacter gelatinilyticus TaxID=372072 RepID=A0A285PIZ1_9HYPH|nr:hypothetical protein [Cohaesibacter gelatinilyticus]SNZ21684.1 hypothetical protein SAMN06265368_4809 [Cohaesibacter gelatinilyticus]